MGNLSALYCREKAEDVQVLAKDSADRPAWILLDELKKDAHFICYDGKDSSRTYYELKFGGLYLPLDASSDEVRKGYKYIAKNYEKINPQCRDVANFIRGKVLEVYDGVEDVAEVFAGTGVVASEIAHISENLDVMDISAEMIEIAEKKKELSKANFFVVDHLISDFRKQYDLVVCSNGLQYLRGENLKHFLEKLIVAQKDGGYFINVGRVNKDIVENYYSVKEFGTFSKNDRDFRYIVALKE